MRQENFYRIAFLTKCEGQRMANGLKLEGQRFGHLTVLKNWMSGKTGMLYGCADVIVEMR